MNPQQKVAPTILIVDDSWTDLALIAAPLYESGYNIVTAVDGNEAIEKALAVQPQCIVLDVVLPKQNGFQVCRRLKRMDECRGIPIILLSSKGTPQDRHWGMQQGADIYLTKPFKRDELLASVRSVLA
jgi:DNA-binding response OmpR family regulator